MPKGVYKRKPGSTNGERNNFFGHRHVLGTRAKISLIQGGTGEIKYCLVCRKDIGIIKPSRIREGKGIFCSKLCFHLGRRILLGRHHPLWKENGASYSAIHAWVRRNFGTPDFCEICKRTDKKKYQWANIGHKYRRIKSDWARLCVRCHSRYDRGCSII